MNDLLIEAKEKNKIFEEINICLWGGEGHVS